MFKHIKNDERIAMLFQCLLVRTQQKCCWSSTMLDGWIWYTTINKGNNNKNPRQVLLTMKRCRMCWNVGAEEREVPLQRGYWCSHAGFCTIPKEVIEAIVLMRLVLRNPVFIKFCELKNGRITSNQRWIGRRGNATKFPPRSPDLTSFDFYLWEILKNMVYATKPQTLEELGDQIEHDNNDTPLATIQTVCRSVRRRCWDIMCQKLDILNMCGLKGV